MGPSPGSRTYLAIFLIALAARIGAIAWFGFSSLNFGDARDYVNAADALARTGQYPVDSRPFVRPPGYPTFLLVATLGHPHAFWAAKIANAVLGAAVCVLLAVLAARLFRKRSVAIGAGLAAAFHPSFLIVSSEVQSEPLFLLLLLASGFWLLAAVDRPSAGLALLAGGALALAALTRPSALCLIPLLGAPFGDRRWPIRLRAHVVAAAGVGFFVVLAPWTLRNALVHHKLIPVTDAFGFSVFAGNSNWNVRFYALESRAQYDAWLQAFEKDVWRRIEELDASGATSGSDRSKALLDATIRDRRADPGSWVPLLWRKTVDWLRPWPNPWFWPRAIVVGVGALYVLLYIFAAVGLWTAQRRGVAGFSLAVLLLSMAFHVVLQVLWRYRVGFWDPILLLYGTAGAATLLRGRRLD